MILVSNEDPPTGQEGAETHFISFYDSGDSTLGYRFLSDNS